MVAILRTGTVVAALATLVACSGGAPTVENPNTTPPTTRPAYNGPPPANGDVQAFMINLWNNIQADDMCGSCHRDNQTPRFVRADDINLAYQEAGTVVDLANPGLSRMVARVRAGHHCWTNDTNVCGDTMTRWISNWASATGGGGTRQIQLTPPTPVDPGPGRIMPTSPTAGGATSFANTVYPVLVGTTQGDCGRCHRADSGTPQQPYFASTDVNEAFEQARTKMNLDSPALSRFVVRLRSESHNCWRIPAGGAVNCAQSATVMENAIVAFASGIPSTPIPTQWVTSKALGLYDGTVASGGSRYDSNVIALYEFKEGQGDIAHDTSGVQPALDLTMSSTAAGPIPTWVAGWGLQFAGGKAQGFSTTSRKLRDMIATTGEYSIEAWAIPGNTSQEESRIISYSGGLLTRNFMMGQTLYSYDFFARSSANNDTNGAPALSTPNGARVLQAALQHVVLTFDPINGRRVYVNGAFTNTQDRANTTIGNWDDTLALVLGNEVSGNRPWMGTLKLVAVHNRALTAPQVAQNFAAGVGEKYLLLFGVGHIINSPSAYVMFEVSIFDNYSYLFGYPKLIMLDAAATPGNVPVRGMRIGINGSEPLVGQAYRPLDIVVTDAMYTPAAGASLSNVGTLVALERGALADQFFLTFEQLGSATNVRVEGLPPIPASPPDAPRSADIGVRTFDSVYETYSQLTGVSKNNAAVKATYSAVKTQLPMAADFNAFLAGNQMGAAQLAISYCNVMVNDATLRTNFFGNVDINSPLSDDTQINAIVDPTVNKVAGLGLSSQPTTQLRDQLRTMINNTDPNNALGLCAGSNTCGPGRTSTVMKVVCAAALGSAVTMVQ